MKFTNKFILATAFAATLLFSTACGGEKAKEGEAAKTEEKAGESSSASVVGKWKLADVNVDFDALPEDMKAKMAAEPKSKEMMAGAMKKMVEEGMSFEFTADGVAKINSMGKDEEAKYEYKDKALTITDKKGPKTVNVTELTDKNMAFTMEESGLKMSMKFDKQ